MTAPHKIQQLMLRSVCYLIITLALTSYKAYSQSLQNLSNQVGVLSILVDDKRDGWESTTPYLNDPTGDGGGTGQIDWDKITMAHDCDDLYVRYEVSDGPMFTPDGFRYNLFLDIDKNPQTGYRGQGAKFPIGADVLIQGGQNKVTVYKFINVDQQTWNWQETSANPISDQAMTNGGRDIIFRVSILDLNVLGTGITGFNWVAWADQASSVQDYYPDGSNLGDAGHFNTYSFDYTSRVDVYANPERGLYESTFTHSNNYKPLDTTILQCYRQIESVSLIHRFFYLEDFVNGDISQQYLDKMQVDFDLARQSGVKLIPRFAYSETGGPSLSPPFNDASKDRILLHLSQLSPILNRNSDIIAVMQTGFIGLWGEWWFSDHFLADSDWNYRNEVLTGLLNVLPASRSVQVRTPRYKQNIFSDTSPVDHQTAHSKTHRSRTGHHNDCFLSSQSDGGTYVNPLTELPYLEEESKWLPMGGETCDYHFLADPSPSRLMCATALSELSALHWSYLNVDWYEPLLQDWQAQGCYDEIEQKLGYKLIFLQGSYNDQIKPGEHFQFKLQLKNEGFAAPFNPRSVELVLRHTSGTIYTYKLNTDPRFWLPGNTQSISDEVVLPANAPPGSYTVLLNLPDPEPTLHNRPEYSIRLANNDSWEPTTGYNKLNHVLTVVSPVYYPHKVVINTGKYDWGTLNSFIASDEDTYDIVSKSTTSGKLTDWYTVTKVTNRPSVIKKLAITYSGQYSVPGVQQTLYLFNFKTAKWNSFNRRTVGNTDDVTLSKVITNHPEYYVSPTGDMRLRLRGLHTNRSFHCWANLAAWTVD